jgi:hypothetical protein
MVLVIQFVISPYRVKQRADLYSSFVAFIVFCVVVVIETDFFHKILIAEQHHLQSSGIDGPICCSTDQTTIHRVFSRQASEELRCVLLQCHRLTVPGTITRT